MQYSYTDQEEVSFKALTLRPFSEYEGVSDSRLLEANFMSCSKFNRAYMQIMCVPSDILYYNDTNEPTNLDFPHRYFHPPASNGVEIMLKTPKIVITTAGVPIPGDPMCITWYFWTSWQHLSVLGDPAPDDGHFSMHNLATEIIQTFEPIPDTFWKVPVMASLPPNFSDLTGPQRIKALMRRIT